jgi:hypothetical protein
VDQKDKLVKVDNSKLAIFEKSLNNIAEYILRHEEVIRGIAQQGSSSNTSAFKEVLKDFDSEINKIHLKIDVHDGHLNSIDKKIRTEVLTSLENFEKQMVQFTNAARTINEKFKTTVDRVSKLEMQLQGFLENSSFIKKLSEEEKENNDLNDLKNSKLTNVDLSA